MDKLLASEQHGVRYARHWLDVLRYADADERMTAAAGIHYWRDWVIYALNSDMPYDQFVRTQLTGYRTTERTQMAAVGVRSKLEPRPDDVFALGFLARGDVVRDGKNTQEMPIMAVETVSTAFMGMTVGCAKCHDHMYDPIKQRDFYAMKALFDPLAIKKVILANPAEIMAQSKALDEAQKRRAAAQAPLDALVAPYKQKLYEDRVAMLPADVQTIIRKPEKERTVAEQKIADDYFPVLRIDDDKIQEIMPPDVLKQYKDLQAKVNQAGGGGGRRGGGGLPAFWTVEWNRSRELEKSYILTSGDPERPEKDKPVEPGWPFAPAKLGFPGRPDRDVFRLADRAGESDVLAGGGEPALAVALWRRPAKELQRFRETRRIAEPPAVTRLAGIGVCRPQVQHERDAPPDGDLRYLQARFGGRPRGHVGQSQSRSAGHAISGATAYSDWKPSRCGIPS